MNLKITYNRNDFINFFRDELLPEDFISTIEYIKPGFKSKYYQTVTFLGECPSLGLNIYEIQHSSISDARIGLSRDAFKLVSRFDKNNALILFVPADTNNFRLSLVTIEPKLDEKGTRVKHEYSNPKRFSFVLGEDAKTHTPEQYLISLGRISDIEDLKKRFSVEVVNKEFYNRIAVMFSKLVGGKRKKGNKTVEFERTLQLPSVHHEDDQKYKEFAVRLIGRTVFCWFLKNKKSGSGIPLVSENVLSTAALKQNPGYYHARVEPLFFEVLNTPIRDRKVLYREEPYQTIPFLNGGLFEPQSDDFYKNNVPNYALKVPDDWWEDFLEILEIYNFTIDENTSIDIELSVDPEMLGRIFENLLAEINPETGETARKATGSYYTPRPIVEYMVDESLKQYLITKTGIEESRLDILLDYSKEESGLTPEEEQQVIRAFDTIKILDPACGSGAFPIGTLQKMLLILQKVDIEAEDSIRKVLEEISDPVKRKLIEAKIKAARIDEDVDFNDYARKLSIIQRSIYGIDIQPIATDISKLRFFLSMIVDEVVQDDQPNRGIEPLPNLEFKFVCANTLIPLPDETSGGLYEDRDNTDKLAKIREDYFISYGEEKNLLRKEFKKVQTAMFRHTVEVVKEADGQTQSRTFLLSAWNPFENEPAPWFDANWMFGINDYFDIILGNPPYISNWSLSELDRDNVIFLGKLYKKYLKGHWDLFICFVAKGCLLLKEQAILTYILPTSFYKEKHSTQIRKHLIDEKQIIELLDFEEQVIFNEVARQTGIFIINNNKQPNDFRTRIRNGLNQPPRYTNQKFFLNLKNNAFKLNVTDNDIQIFSKLNKDSDLLGNYLCINTGVVAHSKKGSPIQFKKNDVIYDQYNEGYKKYVVGSNISQYRIKFDNDYLDYENNKEYFHRPKLPLLFESEKIIIRRISGKNNRFIACYDDRKYYSNDNLMHLLLWNDELLKFQSPEKKWNTKLNNPIDLKYILALLNSTLNTYFFIKFLSTDTLQGSYSSIYPEDIRQIPVKIVDNSIQNILISLVNKIMELNEGDENSKIYEKKVDILFHKLYLLTFNECKIIDPEIEKLISQKDYESKSIEELAEYEIKL